MPDKQQDTGASSLGEDRAGAVPAEPEVSALRASIPSAARCDTCAHWRHGSENEEWEPRHAGFGECVGVRERWRIMDAASEGLAWGQGDSEWSDYEDAPPPEGGYTGVRIAALKAARAYVQDGSEYRAELFTAPDFFCALWTAQRIEAGTDETAQPVRPVGREPDGEADAPSPQDPLRT